MSPATAASDAFFLTGISCLVFGAVKAVRRTGFFFLPLRGFKQFFALFGGKPEPREAVGERYREYRLALEADRSHRVPLLLGFVALGLSALLSFF